MKKSATATISGQERVEMGRDSAAHSSAGRDGENMKRWCHEEIEVATDS